jgi:hypothetical protein
LGRSCRRKLTAWERFGVGLSAALMLLTDLINALPGNSSVNTVKHATIGEAVFSMSSAPHPVPVTDQWTRSPTRNTCFLCGFRHAKIEGLCFLCVVRAERIWENRGIGIDWTRVPKYQGKSSVARRRIRRLSVLRYMCCSTSILGVWFSELLQFLCYKSVPGNE